VETKNHNASTTVNLKLCKIKIMLYLSVIKKTCKLGGNKSNNPN
jgi:hypothetical protein